MGYLCTCYTIKNMSPEVCVFESSHDSVCYCASIVWVALRHMHIVMDCLSRTRWELLLNCSLQHLWSWNTFTLLNLSSGVTCAVYLMLLYLKSSICVLGKRIEISFRVGRLVIAFLVKLMTSMLYGSPNVGNCVSKLSVIWKIESTFHAESAVFVSLWLAQLRR